MSSLDNVRVGDKITWKDNTYSNEDRFLVYPPILCGLGMPVLRREKHGEIHGEKDYMFELPN